MGFKSAQPVMLKNNRQWPEAFFDFRDRKQRCHRKTIELIDSQIFGFNIGKEARNAQLIAPRVGAMRVIFVGTGANSGLTKEFILSSSMSNDKVFSPEGWGIAMTPLTVAASVDMYSDVNMDRRDNPKILDPLDPDMRIDWLAGKDNHDVELKILPYDKIYSFQAFCYTG